MRFRARPVSNTGPGPKTHGRPPLRVAARPGPAPVPSGTGAEPDPGRSPARTGPGSAAGRTRPCGSPDRPSREQ